MELINPSNSLLQKNAFEKAISSKCVRHPQNNADLLHLKPNVKNAKICITCV